MKRQDIYTYFADLIGEEREIELPGFGTGHDGERFRDKAQQFLRAYENDPVIHKLRWNEPLSEADLDALDKILVEGGWPRLCSLRPIPDRWVPHPCVLAAERLRDSLAIVRIQMSFAQQE